MGADLLSILNNGSASLAAQQAASSVISHNLENAATPGYTRQNANLAAALPADFVGNAYVGSGSRLATVSQARDRFLDLQIPAAFGNAAQSSAESQALSAIHALDPQAKGGLADALSGFYSALRALSQNPGQASLRVAVVGASKTLAVAFNRTSSSIEQARSGLDSQISGTLSEVNSLAAGVADLNRQIRIARGSGAEPNDLLDARQNALDRIYTLTGATPVPNANGDIGLALGGGMPLVSGDVAGQLSAAIDTSNGGHLGLQITLPGGSAAQSLSSSAIGGSIGGALAARDGALATATSRLDSLAYELANAANTVQTSGYDLNGDPGQPLFEVGTDPVGAARQMTVTAALAADPKLLAAAASPGLSGDNTNLLALIATETQSLPTSGLGAVATLSSITSQFGAEALRAQASSDQDSAIQKQLETLRQSASGVSIDEELVLMQKAQRAYEAIAKVIQTASSMFETLLQLK